MTEKIRHQPRNFRVNTGFITSSDRVYSWRVAPQHCSLPLHPVNKCKALSGLNKKCKFVSGLLTKLCKLFSGRVMFLKSEEPLTDRRMTKDSGLFDKYGRLFKDEEVKDFL